MDRSRTSREVSTGLVSRGGTASYEGTEAQVEAAIAAYSAAGYHVTRPAPDAPAVVTWMKKAGDKDIPQFTTTLFVRDPGSEETPP